VDAAPRREVLDDHEGPVTVEAYTVMHDRGGEAEVALVATLTPGGRRVWARSTDPAVMGRLVAEEGCGRPAEVAGPEADLRI
jgi:acetyl-CoA C-acetyltransferase